MAIRLQGIDGGTIPLFTGSSIRLLVKELTSGDLLPDAGAYTYTIREDLQQNFSPEAVAQAVWLSIYSPDGRKLIQQEVQHQQTEVALRNFPSGLLFIQLRTEKEQKTYRLLKTNN